ncbi:hypothetical protein ACFLRN_02760 [Thermoproteota archaeon]
MGKLIRVTKKMLKISAEEYEKILRKDKVEAKLLEDRDRKMEECMKRIKEAK